MNIVTEARAGCKILITVWAPAGAQTVIVNCEVHIVWKLVKLFQLKYPKFCNLVCGWESVCQYKTFRVERLTVQTLLGAQMGLVTQPCFKVHGGLQVENKQWSD